MGNRCDERALSMRIMTGARPRTTHWGERTLASASSSVVWRHPPALFQIGTAAGETDGSLLERFQRGPADDAEAAFALLVNRHGPMVLRVCRRMIGDRHEAEDAAQATFFVLARRGQSIRRT